MTQPTIGRVVHYVSYGSPNGEYTSQCRAAIVTEVREGPSKETVGLGVLNPTGLFFDRQVRQEEKTPHPGGTWHWPCVVTVPEEEE